MWLVLHGHHTSVKFLKLYSNDFNENKILKLVVICGRTNRVLGSQWWKWQFHCSMNHTYKTNNNYYLDSLDSMYKSSILCFQVFKIRIENCDFHISFISLKTSTNLNVENCLINMFGSMVVSAFKICLFYVGDLRIQGLMWINLEIWVCYMCVCVCKKTIWNE